MYRARGYGRTTRRPYGRRAIGYGGTSRRKGRRGIFRRAGLYGRYSGNAALRGKERKFNDFNFAGTTILAAGAAVFIPINLMAQGTDVSERLGQKFIVRSIQAKLFVNMLSSATGQALHFRAFLILDKQANGAVPVLLDYLATASTQGLRNVANSNRFKTLKEWDFVINSPGFAGNGTANDSSETLRKMNYFKKCGIAVRMAGVTAAIANVESNNLVFLIMTSNATPVSELNGNFRIRYTDS